VKRVIGYYTKLEYYGNGNIRGVDNVITVHAQKCDVSATTMLLSYNQLA